METPDPAGSAELIDQQQEAQQLIYADAGYVSPH